MLLLNMAMDLLFLSLILLGLAFGLSQLIQHKEYILGRVKEYFKR
tara:strand:- start:3600 stop:3734 length:135 start_codon:yes stop_codon:yes gene_type:complete